MARPVEKMTGCLINLEEVLDLLFLLLKNTAFLYHSLNCIDRLNEASTFRGMDFHRYMMLLVFILIPVLTYPATRHVPDDYPTIQAAVDAAGDGDTVLIADGVYSGPGNIDIQWDATIKHLVIMSENGRDHCTIDCVQEGRGLTLDSGQDARDVIDGLTIINGGEVEAGGAILIDATSPRIINCSLLDNTCYGDMILYYGGGAIMVNGNAHPVIQGNIIRGNFGHQGGGGISFSEGASGLLENNIIDRNETLSDGGGIALHYNSNPLIINNLIINNFASGSNGGGIYTSTSSPAIINNTIAFNTTSIEYYPGKGGGISIYGNPFPVIRNCIIWNNVSEFDAMNIDFYRNDWLDISYCNVENDLGHIFDLKPYTNIDSIPGFIDPDNGNFQLAGNSPCINMGTPDTTGLFLPSTDLSGNGRIHEGRIDIGAYENIGATNTLTSMGGTDFQLYPNPSSGVLVLESCEDTGHDDLVVWISNTRGEIVWEEKIDAAKKRILVDISNQPVGIYLLTITSGQSVLFSQKVVKE